MPDVPIPTHARNMRLIGHSDQAGRPRLGWRRVKRVTRAGWVNQTARTTHSGTTTIQASVSPNGAAEPAPAIVTTPAIQARTPSTAHSAVFMPSTRLADW